MVIPAITDSVAKPMGNLTHFQLKKKKGGIGVSIYFGLQCLMKPQSQAHNHNQS